MKLRVINFNNIFSISSGPGRTSTNALPSFGLYSLILLMDTTIIMGVLGGVNNYQLCG